MDRKSLNIGAFQFSPSSSITENLAAIKRGIESAAQKNVRLLLTQECALTGYPPVEITSIESIDFTALSNAINEISSLAKKYEMYIALGLVSKEGDQAYNSVQLIAPDDTINRIYHKRALWGWDIDNFKPGLNLGIYLVDNIKVGIRICYEVRFPEYFRELFLSEVDLCLLSFADVGEAEQKAKMDIIQSHIVSRATENVMFVLSANSTSQYQLAPTCLVSPDGLVLEKATSNKESLISRTIEFSEPHFGQIGRRVHSKELLENSCTKCVKCADGL